ncbi:hypothetical protein [Bogoriella caseilytica]|uniref:Uncharacterized protein n=1 Tax=Bogoriella caseilytica TaxID=56055 RepID=A0A3N2BC53_9MICO|nr:hypothetical protein [Bogoriella caseilytica]ROR72654.1 hypothetical protein EDD31_1012 [Bogoriella caseilytica]
MGSSAGDVLVIGLSGLFLAAAIGMVVLFLLSGRAALRKRRATATRRRRHRESDARAWAAERGWLHHEGDDELISALPFEALHRALWRRARDLVRGSYHGTQASSWVLEYSHRAENASISVTQHRRLVALQHDHTLPRVDLHPVRGPESLVRGLLARSRRVKLGIREFDRRWLVLTKDPDGAQALLHPGMVERLLQSDLAERDSLVRNPTAEPISIAFAGQQVLAWQGSRTDVEHLDEVLAILHDVHQLVPRHPGRRTSH